MRLGCPNCGAEYEVPDALLASGPRLLRCARCGHQFQAARPVPQQGTETAPVVSAPASAPPAPAPAPAAPFRAEPPRAEVAPSHAPGAAPVERRVAEDNTGRPPPTRGLSRHTPIHPLPEEDEEEEGRGPAATLALAAGWLISCALLGAAAWMAFQYRAEIMEAWPPAARLYQALGLV